MPEGQRTVCGICERVIRGVCVTAKGTPLHPYCAQKAGYVHAEARIHVVK